MLREGRPIIELFLCCFNLCCAWIMHDEDSKRLQVRGDGAPAPLATLALYFEFFNGRTYDDGTTEYLFLRAFAHRLEREPEAANGERKGLEGGRRSKPSIDRRRNSYRRIDKWSRRREEDDKMRRASESSKIGEQSVSSVGERVLSRHWSRRQRRRGK